MADDTTTAAIAVSTGVVGALRAAGVLGAEGAPSGGDAPPPPPPPPPAPPRSVGDQVSIFPLVAVAKSFETQPKDVLRFTLTEARRSVRGDERGGDFELDFPPNDASYIPELERLLTAALTGGTIHARANVEITAGIYAGFAYRAELRGLGCTGATSDRAARAPLTGPRAVCRRTHGSSSSARSLRSSVSAASSWASNSSASSRFSGGAPTGSMAIDRRRFSTSSGIGRSATAGV